MAYRLLQRARMTDETCRFGEFLVRRRALSRAELLWVLWRQGRRPGIRLGEVAVGAGLLSRGHLHGLLRDFRAEALGVRVLSRVTWDAGTGRARTVRVDR